MIFCFTLSLAEIGNLAMTTYIRRWFIFLLIGSMGGFNGGEGVNAYIHYMVAQLCVIATYGAVLLCRACFV